MKCKWCWEGYPLSEVKDHEQKCNKRSTGHSTESEVKSRDLTFQSRSTNSSDSELISVKCKKCEERYPLGEVKEHELKCKKKCGTSSTDSAIEGQALVIQSDKFSMSLSYEDMLLITSGAWLNDNVYKFSYSACMHSSL